MVSVCLSAFVAGAITAMSAILIHREKISVRPIGAVEFVTSAPENSTKPISDILGAWASGGSAAPKGVWAGYFVDLQKLCAAGAAPLGAPTVVLFKSAGELKAGTTQLGPRSCQLVDGLKPSEKVYAASDQPFPSTPSEKRFVAVNEVADVR